LKLLDSNNIEGNERILILLTFRRVFSSSKASAILSNNLFDLCRQKAGKSR
jgi:hypothetical protein